MKESKGKVTLPSQITNTTCLTSHITIACVDPVPPLPIDALVDKTRLILKSCIKIITGLANKGNSESNLAKFIIT